MRDISPIFHQALIDAQDNSIKPRKFVYVTGKLISNGSPATLGFWSGDDDINISVLSPITGLLEARTYYGQQNLEVSPIVRSSDLTIQQVDVSLTQLSPVAQQLIREYDIRLGKIEIHEIVLDGLMPVSPPEIIFLGEIDKAPLTTPSIGQDGEIKITAVSDAISMLTITNPMKSSLEGQKSRDVNDHWGIYSSTIKTWDIPWAREKG